MEKSRKTKFHYASLIMIVTVFTLFATYLFNVNMVSKGDGNEYILQTVAVQNHFSFGINEQDLEKAKTQFYDQQSSLQATFEYIVHDEDGVAFSNHFGAYSVLVTPIKLILIALGVYPLWAFSITNYLLWLAAVLVIFFCLKVDDKRKFCILALIMFNPAFFYLDWTHPEIYLFSFVVIGLVFLNNKQHAFSILAFTIASIQNVGVFPLAVIAGLDYIIDCYEKYKVDKQEKSIKEFISSYWKRIIPYGLFYLPTFIPMITTYIRFGTFNLVAKVAMENKYLLQKGIQYVLDPNMGILPYEPFILIGFVVLLIVGFKKFPRKSILNLLGVVGMLFIIAHQVQINSGMECIMRYCVWIIPVLIFFVVMNWPLGKDKSRSVLIVSLIEALFTALLVSYCVWWGGGYSNSQFSPWTKVILDVAPQIYNPTHGIFYSRSSGAETYYSARPCVYTNDEGYIRKILLSKEAEIAFYSDDWVLVTSEGKLVDKSELDTYSIDEGDFKYINFTDETTYQYDYNIDDIIYFQTDEYNATEYIHNGISYPEIWGSWTNGDQVNIKMWIDDDVEFIHAYIDVYSSFFQPQDVSIIVDDEEVYSGTISGDQDISFIFKKPEDNIVDLIMLLPDSISPAEAMESTDNRDLGLGLASMKLSEADIDAKKLPEDGIIWFYSDAYNADQYVLSGISDYEESASWTDGTKMTVLFSTSEFGSTDDKLHGTIDLANIFNNEQFVTVTANGEVCFAQTVTSEMKQIEFDFTNPEDGNIELTLKVPNAISPLDLGMSEDSRNLALMIRNIIVTE